MTSRMKAQWTLMTTGQSGFRLACDIITYWTLFAPSVKDKYMCS